MIRALLFFRTIVYGKSSTYAVYTASRGPSATAQPLMAALCNRAGHIYFHLVVSSLWSPYVIGQTIIFLPCNFYLSFFLRLISAVGDWMSTILPYMVWPYCEFRMQV